MAEFCSVSWFNHSSPIIPPQEASGAPDNAHPNDIGATFVGWDLVTAQPQPLRSAPTTDGPATVRPGLSRSSREILHSLTGLKKVDLRHLAPGSKYRGICKIKAYFRDEPQRCYHSSGWLMDDSLVVTAGHCVYREGHATRIEIFLGYHGQDSITSDYVEFRLGAAVITPVEWVRYESRLHDLALIKVTHPFNNKKPVLHVDTPQIGHHRLAIVGYPCEREYAEFMYEISQEVSWDLAESRGTLTYAMCASSGMSGAPVLLEGLPWPISIGVHSYQIRWFKRATSIGPAGVILGQAKRAMEVRCQNSHAKQRSAFTSSVPSEYMQVSVPPTWRWVSEFSSRTTWEPGHVNDHCMAILKEMQLLRQYLEGQYISEEVYQHHKQRLQINLNLNFHR